MDATIVWSELEAPLRAFLARRVPPEVDVDDVLQDVFLRIHDRLPEFDDQSRLDAWIFQVTRNALVDTLRRKRRARAGLGDPVDGSALDDVEATVDEDDRPLAKEFLRCLAPMIARLDPPYREAIELIDLGDLTHAEGAARLGISVSGMKSRVQRGREKLRELFLRCCAMEFDGRGGLVEYAPRVATDCRGCAAPAEKKKDPS